jgi:hypothetical protein
MMWNTVLTLILVALSSQVSLGHTNYRDEYPPDTFSMEAVSRDALNSSAPTPKPVKAAAAASMKEKHWNPPKSMRADLDAVWKRNMKLREPKPNPLVFDNFLFNIVMANKGKLNFCVRWESKQKAPPETRKLIDQFLARHVKRWMDLMVGYDDWPYKNVPVKVVGWTAKSKNLVPDFKNATFEGRLYTGKDSEGHPTCNEECRRWSHREGKYPKCPGGNNWHYDLDFRLIDGYKGAGVCLPTPATCYLANSDFV